MNTAHWLVLYCNSIRYFTKFQWAITLYSLLLAASGTRIILRFLPKRFQRLKAYGYTILSAICILLGIILCSKFNDQNEVGDRIWKAEIPLGVITIISSLIFLTDGLLITQRGNTGNSDNSVTVSPVTINSITVNSVTVNSVTGNSA